MNEPTLTEPSTFAVLVLFATMGFTLWGGLMLGPRRIVPMLLIVGPLFLPALDKFDLPGLPALDRLTVVALPAFVLLIVTPRSCWKRFRLVLPDVFLLSYVAWTAICTTVNQGPYAGGAMGFRQAITLMVPYFAGRLYLQDKEDIIALAKVLMPIVLVYIGLMAFEARMYPHFQEWVYGREVMGLGRLGLFRPVVFAGNALELGHLMTLIAIVLIAVYRCGGATRAACGRFLVPGIAAACVGVLLSLSRGPIVGLLAGLATPMIFRRTGLVSCIGAVGGLLFFLWMLSPGGSGVLAGLSLASDQSESGQNLLFRFLQVESYKPMIEASPIFGYGETWDREFMTIIDGELLLTALGFGYPGAALLSLFWLSCVWMLGQRVFPRKGTFQHLGAHLAPVLGWLVFTSWGDSFLRAPHYVLMGGAIAALASVRYSAAEKRQAEHPMREVELSYG